MEEESACGGDSVDIGCPNGNNTDLNAESVPSYDIFSPEYEMNFPEKSLCYIFNHTQYFPALKMEKREGSDADCAKIYECFSQLNFEIYPFTDKTVCEIMTQLESVGEKNHSKRAAFVCFILTHGNQRKLYAYDGKYAVEDVFKKFSHDKCPSFNGKPKLFFIQACGGKKFDCGIPVRVAESSDGAGDFFKIPGLSDFFIAFSSVKDFVSFRNKSGSIFIKFLCECLDMYAKDRDLLHIMTFVNQKVAQFESHSRDPLKDRKKQISCVWFTLTKFIKFPVLSLENSCS